MVIRWIAPTAVIGRALKSLATVILPPGFITEATDRIASSQSGSNSMRVELRPMILNFPR